jgi:hypothetical protein
MKPGNLKHFATGLRTAARYGVELDYRKRFRAAHKAGMVPQEAAETALREAINAVNPRAALGVTLTFKEGHS